MKKLDEILKSGRMFEHELLSELIFRPDLVKDIIGEIKKEDFYFFGSTFKAIVESAMNGKSLLNECSKRGISLADFTEMSTRHPIAICKDLREVSSQRNLYAILEDAIINMPSQGVEGFVSDIQHKLLNGVSKTELQNADAESVIKEFRATRAIYEEKFKNGTGIIGISTGFKKIDDMIDGLRPEHFWVIGAYTSMGKCHAKGTKILMYNGLLKEVENMKVGDKVMGIDNKPRTILQLAQGNEEMYRITPDRRESFVVNKNHILCLKRTGTTGRDRRDEIINITIEDYLKKSKSFKHIHKLWSKEILFKTKKVEVDPYLLGLWLGDGTASLPQITSIDTEIVGYLNDWCLENNSYLSQTTDGISYRINGKNNKFLAFLRKNNLIKNKHIPNDYLINSVENRLQLLAGLIDTDGYRTENKYEFANTNKKLAEQVTFLARSLGFHASMTKKVCETNFTKDKPCTSYRVYISGETWNIPVKIKRKKILCRKLRTNPLLYSFKVESVGKGDFYGFTLDGDHLYFIENLIVNHNTFMALNIIVDLINQGKRVVFYSLEMSQVDIMSRLLGIMAKQNGLEIIKGMAKDDALVEVSLAKIQKSGFSVYNGKSELTEILFSMHEEMSKQHVDLFVIDFIQLMTLKTGKSEYEVITNCSVELQKMARRIKTPIIVLSQISNEGARHNEEFVMSFKGSGAIAAAADMAIQIVPGEENVQEFKRKMQAKEPVTMKWVIKKNRHGRVGYIDMTFNGTTGTFTEQKEVDAIFAKKMEKEKEEFNKK